MSKYCLTRKKLQMVSHIYSRQYVQKDVKKVALIDRLYGAYVVVMEEIQYCRICYVNVLAVATERLFLILEKEKRTFIIIISSSKEDEILVQQTMDDVTLAYCFFSFLKRHGICKYR